MKLVFKITVLFFYINIFLFAQKNSKPDFITVIPGEEYAAGKFHQFLFGEHWRELWTSPINVEVINLNNFDGGLIPIKKGGGQQTKSLRLYSKNGKTWKFRSINKDPAKVLPAELRESLVASVIQDQISSANPYAPLIVAPLLREVEILQAEPHLVFMPDSPALGEFREEFGNILGMIEIHPDEIDDSVPGFEGADKVKGTLDLFERLEKDPEEKVNKVEFLKARLMDVFLGDWDRHTDQWKWVRYWENGIDIWRPIPRDRDQPFAKFDGLLPSLAEYVVPQFNTFDYDYSSVEKITWNGRYVDRHFLTEIDKYTWDSVTAFIQKRLTDKVIENAVMVLPELQFEIAGKELIDKLKSRRDNLFGFSNDYYNFVNKYLDIFCTDHEDSVFVNRIDDYRTEVKVFSKEKKSDNDFNILHFSKIFNNEITDDIRIHLLEDDDKAVVVGNVNTSPVIRIIGGKGKDSFEDNSIVNGYFLTITPFAAAENRTRFYDSGSNSDFIKGPGTSINTEKVPDPQTQTEKYEPALRDRGHHWRMIPVLSLDSDNGVIAGISPFVKKHNFRADPYEYKMTFTLMYAALPKSAGFGFNGIFTQYIKNANVIIDAELTELKFTKYFGYGNETSFSQELYDNDFYKLDQELFYIMPRIEFLLNNQLKTSIGFSYNYWESTLKNRTLISNFPFHSTGLGNMKLVGMHGSFDFNSLDFMNEPTKGIQVNSNIAYFPKLWANENSFLKTSLDAKGYITAKTFTDITLALRAGAGKVFGNYLFFEGMFLGGPDNLRGYVRDRFAGDSYIFTKAEIRTYLTEVKFIIRGKLGFQIFAETGRVFAQGQKSDKWHPSYGGGMWLSYLNSELVGSAYIAGSPEGLQYYLNFGFGF